MSRCRIHRSLALLCVGLALFLSGCRVDWATWGYGVERQGFNPAEDTIGTANVAQLRHLWSVELGAAIDAATIVASRLNVGARPPRSCTSARRTACSLRSRPTVRSCGTAVWA